MKYLTIDLLHFGKRATPPVVKFGKEILPAGSEIVFSLLGGAIQGRDAQGNSAPGQPRYLFYIGIDPIGVRFQICWRIFSASYLRKWRGTNERIQRPFGTPSPTGGMRMKKFKNESRDPSRSPNLCANGGPIRCRITCQTCRDIYERQRQKQSPQQHPKPRSTRSYLEHYLSVGE